VTDHCVISIVLQQCLPVAAAEIVDGSFCAELHTYTHACTHTHTHTHTGRPSQPEQIKMSICQFLQCIAGLLLLLLFGLYLKCVSVLVSKTALSQKICCRHCIRGVHTRTGRSWDTETKGNEQCQVMICLSAAAAATLDTLLYTVFHDVCGILCLS